MAEKIKIEIYRKKEFEELTKSLADPESRTDTGSAAAATAAIAASLFSRAAALCLREDQQNERLQYLARNAEILRDYMVHLVDEDVKCRGPLRRAMQEGDARKIEAASQTAAAINNEIINMMGTQLELLEELAARAKGSAAHFVTGSAELAMGAIKASVHYVVDLSRSSSDDTYRFVVRRENEMSLERFEKSYESILKKLCD